MKRLPPFWNDKRYLALRGAAFALVVSAAGCGRTELRIGGQDTNPPSPAVFDASVPATRAMDAGRQASAGTPSGPSVRPPSQTGIDAGPGPSGTPVPRFDAGTPAACARGYAGTDCSTCVVFVDVRSQCSLDCGGSWATAFPSLQEALEQAEQRAPCEVWVGSGTYYASAVSNREESFRLRPNVALYGGFIGRETLRDDRNWERNATVLSGDIGAKGDPSDNAYHVVIGADNAILDGFEISAGRADGTYLEPDAGYAAYPYEQSNGGGIMNYQVAPTLENCSFTNNYAASSGGAMFNYSADPKIIHCRFSENVSSGNGGVMLNQAASPEIVESLFVRNEATQGGVMYNLDRASPHLLRSMFRQNVAHGYGGVIRNQWAPPHLEDSTFVDNVAEGGGGVMYTDYTNTPKIERCVFARNRSNAEGGAIFTTLSHMRISNSVFVGNVSAACGGAICEVGSELTVTNCTIVANRGTQGALGDREQSSGPAVIINSILWDNGPEEIVSYWQVPNVTYSVVQGGCEEADPDDAGVPDGPVVVACTSDDRGNSAADPRFVRAPGWSDAGVFDSDYDLHLASDSPCIGAAHASAAPAEDLDKQARDDKPDIGAYEH